MKKLLPILALLIAPYASAQDFYASAQDFDKGTAAYDEKDYATAPQEWRPLAEQGWASAQFNLGVMYQNGYGTPLDYEEALKWYQLSYT
jgi:TPR repeat protein